MRWAFLNHLATFAEEGTSLPDNNERWLRTTFFVAACRDADGKTNGAARLKFTPAKLPAVILGAAQRTLDAVRRAAQEMQYRRTGTDASSAKAASPTLLAARLRLPRSPPVRDVARPHHAPPSTASSLRQATTLRHGRGHRSDAPRPCHRRIHRFRRRSREWRRDRGCRDGTLAVPHYQAAGGLAGTWTFRRDRQRSARGVCCRASNQSRPTSSSLPSV
jgi:hypothetical protein